MPPRRTARDERGASRRPASRRPAEEDEEFVDDEDQELDDQDEELDDQGPEPEEDVSDPAPARGRGGGKSARHVTAADAAKSGVRSLVDLIGKQPEGVTAIEPTDDGWLVGVEVIEDQRVPSSADILAVYEAALDPDGDLVSYRRTARYARGKGSASGDGLDDE